MNKILLITSLVFLVFTVQPASFRVINRKPLSFPKLLPLRPIGGRRQLPPRHIFNSTPLFRGNLWKNSPNTDDVKNTLQRIRNSVRPAKNFLQSLLNLRPKLPTNSSSDVGGLVRDVSSSFSNLINSAAAEDTAANNATTANNGGDRDGKEISDGLVNVSKAVIGVAQAVGNVFGTLNNTVGDTVGNISQLAQSAIEKVDQNVATLNAVVVGASDSVLGSVDQVSSAIHRVTKTFEDVVANAGNKTDPSSNVDHVEQVASAVDSTLGRLGDAVDQAASGVDKIRGSFSVIKQAAEKLAKRFRNIAKAGK